MSYQLMNIAKEEGLQLATHVWSTTVASQLLIAAPGATKCIWLRYIVTGASSSSSGTIAERLTNGTTAGTTYWQYPLAAALSEEAHIKFGANEPASLFVASGTGNGFIRVYYSIKQDSGTTE
jgi:hypothetical protein